MSAANLDAEESLLGAMLLSRDAVMAATSPEAPEVPVTAADFFDPRHASIYLAIVELYGEGSPIDPTTVAEALRARGTLDASGGKRELMRLQAATPASANARAYARIVARLGRFRRAAVHGEAITLAANEAAADDGARLDRLLLEPPDLAPALPPAAETVELDALLARPDPVAKPWVVPGLIRAGEVLVLTGGEGAGKMTLLRQLGLGVAAGIHPLTDLPMRRGHTLVIDLQEDLTELRSELGRMRRHVPHYQAGGMHLVSRRQGIDLAGAHDGRWLEALIAEHRPTLVVAGPLKKLYRPPEGRSIWDDDLVENVHRKLDDLQMRYGFALALEGHAGHDRDTWRVKGSSAWYAWPHFGYGMNPVSWRPREVELVRWRGDRENGVPRHFPPRLFEGEGWPWRAGPNAVDLLIHAAPDGFDQPTLDDEPF